MKRKVLTICIISAILFPLKANAFSVKNLFGALLNKKTAQTTENSVLAKDVSTSLADLKKQSDAIDASVRNSFITMTSRFSPEQEVNEIKAKVNSIYADKTTSDVQKSELFAQLMDDYATSLKKNKANYIDTIKNMPQTEKTNLSNNANDLYKYGQEYMKLGKQGVSVAANAMKNATKSDNLKSILSDVHQSVTEVKDKAQATLKLSSQVQVLSKSAGLIIKLTGE